jgi:predicted nucleic acid-binding protein
MPRKWSTFDSARAYERIYAGIVMTGRKARGPRAVDLLIVATAVATNLPLYARTLTGLGAIGSPHITFIHSSN